MSVGVSVDLPSYQVSLDRWSISVLFSTRVHADIQFSIQNFYRVNVSGIAEVLPFLFIQFTTRRQRSFYIVLLGQRVKFHLCLISYQ